MKQVIYLLLLVGLLGCGKDNGLSFDGKDGTNGKDGANGTNGTNGTNGIDANPVTVIKLCPGDSTYGATYVEVAFCIGDTLYATYSANGGFSTEIPPGTYSSNGINSSCTFTVDAHCVVHP